MHRKKYVIMTDSCCDLTKDLRDAYQIEYIKMPLACSGRQIYADLDWAEFSPQQFYQTMRQGEVYKTSQINVDAYVEAFEPYIKKGFDILSISCSSALSGSVNCSMIARNILRTRYLRAKVVCVDSMRASMGEGLLCIHAAKLRASGKKIDETAREIENLRSYVHQAGTVESLLYLKRSGRVTGNADFLAEVLNIKPFIIANEQGENQSVSRIKGRQSSLRALADYAAENITDPQTQTVMLVHADCPDDAAELKQMLDERTHCKDVYIAPVGALVGSATGPGMIGVYFFGQGK